MKAPAWDDCAKSTMKDSLIGVGISIVIVLALGGSFEFGKFVGKTDGETKTRMEMQHHDTEANQFNCDNEHRSGGR